MCGLNFWALIQEIYWKNLRRKTSFLARIEIMVECDAAASYTKRDCDMRFSRVHGGRRPDGRCCVRVVLNWQYKQILTMGQQRLSDDEEKLSKNPLGCRPVPTWLRHWSNLTSKGKRKDAHCWMCFCTNAWLLMHTSNQRRYLKWVITHFLIWNHHDDSMGLESISFRLFFNFPRVIRHICKG